MKPPSLSYQPDDLLCGIDGGGTTSKVVVCTRDGVVVQAWHTGTINHYGAGTDTVRANFHAIAGRLVETCGCLPQHIFAGNSALSNRASREMVDELTDGAFRGVHIHFHADVYVALLGFTGGKPGAVLISGTGSMACGIDPAGNYHTAGGWGQVLGDEGSAYYIGLEGMKAALHAYDGLADATRLTEQLKRFFHVADMSDIIAKVYHPPLEKRAIAAFATAVDEAARDGDRTAKQILERAGAWLYLLALAICRRCQTTHLGYTGGVLIHNSVIRDEVRHRLQPHGIALQQPRFNPELGALIAAFLEAGIPLTDTILNNLLTYQREQQHE